MKNKLLDAIIRHQRIPSHANGFVAPPFRVQEPDPTSPKTTKEAGPSRKRRRRRSA